LNNRVAFTAHTQRFLVRGAAVSGSPIPPTWGEKDTRQAACSAVRFPNPRVEDERDAAIPFQNSEFVLYVLFAPVWSATFLRRGGPTSEMVNSDVSRNLKWKEEISYLDSP
jgi:hypothetical protein